MKEDRVHLGVEGFRRNTECSATRDSKSNYSDSATT